MAMYGHLDLYTGSRPLYGLLCMYLMHEVIRFNHTFPTSHHVLRLLAYVAMCGLHTVILTFIRGLDLYTDQYTGI